MKKKYLWIVVIVFVLITLYLGFTYLNLGEISKTTSKQQLIDYYEKFEQSNVKLNYAFKSQSSFTPSTDLKMEFYNLNNVSRISNSGITNKEIYFRNDYAIACSYFYSNEKGNYLRCINKPPEELFSLKLYDSTINQAEITYSGIKTIADRNCDDFNITLNIPQTQHLIDKLFGKFANLEAFIQPGETAYSNFEVCMDKEYGYPALYNLKLTIINYTSKEIIREDNLFSIELIEMSNDVKESDLTAFVFNSFGCNSKAIFFNLTSLQDLDEVSIDVNLYSAFKNLSFSSQLKEIKGGKIYPINMDVKDKIVGTPESAPYYSADICVNNYCNPDSCYFLIL